MNTLTTKSAAAALLRPIAKVRPLLSKTDIREYRISASDLARVEVEARRWARKAHGRIGKAEIRELVLRERGGNSHRDWLAWRTPGWLGRDWHDHAGFPAQRRMRDDMLLRAKRGDAFFEGNPFVGRMLHTHPSLARVQRLSMFLAPLSKDEILFLKDPA